MNAVLLDTNIVSFLLKTDFEIIEELELITTAKRSSSQGSAVGLS